MVSPVPRISVEHAQRPLFAGVDVGGTTIKLAVVDDWGRTLAARSLPTEEERGAEDAVQRIADCLRGLLREQGLSEGDLTSVGLGTPGTMDIPRGVILEPPNLPHWRDFPIRDRLAEACGQQVYLSLIHISEPTRRH